MSMEVTRYLMTLLLLLSLISTLLLPILTLSSPPAALQNPEVVVQQVHKAINHASTKAIRRNLGYLSCGTGNPIDDCWRCEPNWHQNRHRLADCAIGFGKNATGGRDGPTYTVTNPGQDDPINPKPGTLRHAAIQDGPLWIVFAHDMVIHLKAELTVTSHKTIDGRGATVHIGARGGPCLTLRSVTNVIVHGVHIHGCRPSVGAGAMVRDSPGHYGWRVRSGGDGIAIYGSRHVWVDHCSLSNCTGGLINVARGSTGVTVSNSYMAHQDRVMVLGHSDRYVKDREMQVTVAFNRFGEGLVQSMPRCRHGYFHVVNNDYTHWEKYAIGGSASPTINSQGNRFIAPDHDDLNIPNNLFSKEVTKHEGAPETEWRKWNWRSEGDLFLNGAYFTPSGAGASSYYARASSLSARPSSLVGEITADAGVLACGDKEIRC